MSKPFVHFNTEHTIVLRKFLTKKKKSYKGTPCFKETKSLLLDTNDGFKWDEAEISSVLVAFLRTYSTYFIIGANVHLGPQVPLINVPQWTITPKSPRKMPFLPFAS